MVPYYSQFLDVDDSYWSTRACGFCSFKMVTESLGVATPSVLDLANQAKKEGGYGESGIIHDYVIKLAEKYGLKAHREEKMDDERGLGKIVSYLKKDNPVIVSIAKERDGKKLFHQIVMTGFKKDESGNLLRFYINEPEAKTISEGKHILVSKEDFLKKWRRMAIFIEKK